MSMEMKQHLKLSQQLVMTPQLQQAIKLLQLSRMELCDLVREEMLENPILEDASSRPTSRRRRRDAPATADGNGADVERAGETETPIAEIRDGRRSTRPPRSRRDSNSNEAVNEIDWENYLDNYSAAPPMPSYRPDNEELPSLEATLTRGDVAPRPPGVAAQAEQLHAGRRRHRDADHRQPRRRRLLQGSAARGSRPRRRRSTLEHGGIRAQADPGLRSDRRRAPARSRSAC